MVIFPVERGAEACLHQTHHETRVRSEVRGVDPGKIAASGGIGDGMRCQGVNGRNKGPRLNKKQAPLYSLSLQHTAGPNHLKQNLKNLNLNALSINKNSLGSTYAPAGGHGGLDGSKAGREGALGERSSEGGQVLGDFNQLQAVMKLTSQGKKTQNKQEQV